MLTIALGSLERLLNALLAESTAARERATGLEGKRLGLRLVGPDIEIVAHVAGSQLRLERASAHAADAALSGTPIALLRAARLGKTGLLADGGVTFNGDAQVLEEFVQLFELAKPDLEEELSRATGDVIAHEAFRVAGSVSAWTRRALDALALNTAEYLQEESRDLPARHEAEGFYGDVESLRDDVERALARGERLTGQRRASGGTEER